MDILMCVLFPISTHTSFGLSTKLPLTLLISWAITLRGGLSWKKPSIMRDRILFHKVYKVKIQVLEFSKWKFEVKHFWSIKTLTRSIEMVKKKSWSFWMSRSLLDSCSIDWNEFSTDRKSKINIFLQNFLVTVQRVWRCFKPCKRLYEIF